MVNWNTLRQFGHTRGGSIVHAYHPKGEDLLQIYAQSKVYLYGVKDMTLQWAKTGPGHAGTRAFKYNKIPPLVFWNPDVQITQHKVLKGDSLVKFTMNNGETHQFVTTNMTAEQIFKTMMEKVHVIAPNQFPEHAQEFEEKWKSMLDQLTEAPYKSQ
eukprot:TRINITY_DN23305_c0_g1_i1.p1 TRINITY_DN23305_c0_g1~~TRINITY_DN23305_c0_g1_i1.p1  ORF type:complete len:157 (+),score=33.82 TRINITY_DN23305_c0_g1_i1:146-616(+)